MTLKLQALEDWETVNTTVWVPLTNEADIDVDLVTVIVTIADTPQVPVPWLKVIEQPEKERPSKVLENEATNTKVDPLKSIPVDGEKLKVSFWKLEDL